VKGIVGLLKGEEEFMAHIKKKKGVIGILTGEEMFPASTLRFGRSPSGRFGRVSKSSVFAMDGRG
jgi:hypothetical protein